VLVVTIGLGRYLFAVSSDEEYARATGMPVLTFNILLALVTAVTVVVSMRVVGLLLISALMIVPVATARLVARSFRATVAVAVVLGVAVSVAGVATSFYTDTPSGGTIVLIAVALFALTAGASTIRHRWHTDSIGAQH
jgi:zinc transport system permease protein